MFAHAPVVPAGLKVKSASPCHEEAFQLSAAALIAPLAPAGALSANVNRPKNLEGLMPFQYL